MLLLCMGFLLFFYKVGDRDLWAPDEDEYAQMSREMIRYGHWIFPTVNGQPWAIKPVLYNWLIAAISLPGGDVNEFDARVFSALAALGTFLLTFYLGRSMFSPLAGFLGATVLGTSILFLKFARSSSGFPGRRGGKSRRRFGPGSWFGSRRGGKVSKKIWSGLLVR